MRIRKSKSDTIIDSIADLDERLRKIEMDLGATKKALSLLIWIGKIVAIIVGIVVNCFMFGRGRSGKRGKEW